MSFAHGGSSAAAFREEVCCFGDSITQHGHCAHGWVAGLQEAYRRRADVLNRGYSGYSSRFGVHMLPRLFGPARRYLFTTVFFGANDAADAASKPAQHVPLGEYEANMAAIVHAARQVSAHGACCGAARRAHECRCANQPALARRPWPRAGVALRDRDCAASRG